MFTALLIGVSFASTPDGETPAVESVCDDFSGASYGLCVAYCEATDCDTDEAKADDNACDTLHAKFVKHAGEEPPCAEKTYNIQLAYSGDDTVYAYLNGVAFPFVDGPDGWWSVETVQDFPLPSGTHTFAFHVTDVARAYVGLSASISVGGVVTATTGDGSFIGTTTNPGPSFASPAFVASGWNAASLCQYNPWSSVNLAVLTAAGADWVWADGGTCLYDAAAPNAWFRTTLVLP